MLRHLSPTVQPPVTGFKRSVGDLRPVLRFGLKSCNSRSLSTDMGQIGPCRRSRYILLALFDAEARCQSPRR